MHCSVRSKRTQSTTVWCARAKHVILTPHRCMLPLSSLRFLWPSPSLPPLFHSVPPLTSLRSVSSRSIKQSCCTFLSLSHTHSSSVLTITSRKQRNSCWIVLQLILANHQQQQLQKKYYTVMALEWPINNMLVG